MNFKTMVEQTKPKESLFSQIKKTITFIFKIDDKEKLSPYGTGFFVSVPVEGRENRNVGYFVTAKHVLQDEKGNWLPKIFLRMNQLDGQISYTDYPIEPKNIFTHKEPEVDLAVIAMRPRLDVIEFKTIPQKIIATEEKIKKDKIEEGDDVFFTGLFTSYMGNQKNHPITRFGKVALMTDEKIDWHEKGKSSIKTNLFLIECQTFGGNSGSPVFFQIGPKLESGEFAIGPPSFYLAGIVKGSFLNASETQNIETVTTTISYENVGISAVTPAYKLNEILFYDEVIDRRKKTPD